MTIKSFEQASNTLQSLKESLWTFASLSVIFETTIIEKLITGASLSLLEQSTKLPVSILEQILNLLTEAGFLTNSDNYFKLSPGMFEYVEKFGIEHIKAQCRMAFGMSNEFIKSSRENKLIAGWHHTDESILQAQGKFSEQIVNEFFQQDSELQDALEQSGAHFLDVGAGVARITLRLCELYNNLRVTAVEPAGVPFSLAKINIEQSNYGDRIELRNTTIEALEDKNVFDVAWYPQVFFSDTAFTAGLNSVWRALKPGGKILVIAILANEKSPSVYVRKLINALQGGLRTVEEVSIALENSGFKDNKKMTDQSGSCQVIIAKKPA